MRQRLDLPLRKDFARKIIYEGAKKHPPLRRVDGVRALEPSNATGGGLASSVAGADQTQQGKEVAKAHLTIATKGSKVVGNVAGAPGRPACTRTDQTQQGEEIAKAHLVVGTECAEIICDVAGAGARVDGIRVGQFSNLAAQTHQVEFAVRPLAEAGHSKAKIGELRRNSESVAWIQSEDIACAVIGEEVFALKLATEFAT